MKFADSQIPQMFTGIEQERLDIEALFQLFNTPSFS